MEVRDALVLSRTMARSGPSRSAAWMSVFNGRLLVARQIGNAVDDIAQTIVRIDAQLFKEGTVFLQRRL